MQPAAVARALSELGEQGGHRAQDHQDPESPDNSGGMDMSLQKQQGPIQTQHVGHFFAEPAAKQQLHLFVLEHGDFLLLSGAYSLG